MKEKINISNFINGFNLGQFHRELLLSSFANKVKNVSYNLESVFVNLLLLLDENEKTELNTIVSNHVKIEKTELEILSLKITTTDDYLKLREEMKLLISDFDSLNDKEKEIAAKYCLVTDNIIVSYYMEQGLTLENATIKHKIRRAEDINKAAKSCTIRAESPVIKYLMIKYLSISDASSLIQEINSHISDYKTVAHLGLNYGQDRVGIMDYIEATNDYESSGLSAYTFVEPFTFEQCRDELKQFLVYGIEPSEYNSF